MLIQIYVNKLKLVIRLCLIFQNLVKSFNDTLRKKSWSLASKLTRIGQYIYTSKTDMPTQVNSLGFELVNEHILVN